MARKIRNTCAKCGRPVEKFINVTIVNDIIWHNYCYSENEVSTEAHNLLQLSNDIRSILYKVRDRKERAERLSAVYEKYGHEQQASNFHDLVKVMAMGTAIYLGKKRGKGSGVIDALAIGSDLDNAAGLKDEAVDMAGLGALYSSVQRNKAKIEGNWTKKDESEFQQDTAQAVDFISEESSDKSEKEDFLKMMSMLGSLKAKKGGKKHENICPHCKISIFPGSILIGSVLACPECGKNIKFK